MRLRTLAMQTFLSLAIIALFANRAIADNAAEITQGKGVYKTNCETCHGEKFDGMGATGQYLNPRPRNLLIGKYKNGDGPAQIFKTVTTGIKGTQMAAFNNLSEPDRHAVAAYLVSVRKKK